MLPKINQIILLSLIHTTFYTQNEYPASPKILHRPQQPAPSYLEEINSISVKILKRSRLSRCPSEADTLLLNITASAPTGTIPSISWQPRETQHIQIKNSVLSHTDQDQSTESPLTQPRNSLSISQINATNS